MPNQNIVSILKDTLKKHPKLSVSRLLLLVQFEANELTASEFCKIAGMSSARYTRAMLDEAVQAGQLTKIEIASTGVDNTRFVYSLSKSSKILLKKLRWYHGKN